MEVYANGYQEVCTAVCTSNLVCPTSVSTNCNCPITSSLLKCDCSSSQYSKHKLCSVLILIL